MISAMWAGLISHASIWDIDWCPPPNSETGEIVRSTLVVRRTVNKLVKGEYLEYSDARNTGTTL